MSLKHIKHTDYKIKTKVYQFKIEDKTMDDQMKDLIDQLEDVQKRSSNVKAKMTNWRMSEETGFKTLCNHVLHTMNFVARNELNSNGYYDKFKIWDMWGMNYKKDDHAVLHAHLPAYFSFSYYPFSSSDPIVFPDIDFKVEPYEGMLLLFPAYLPHLVNLCVDEDRYVVSGNIILKD